MGVLKLTIDVVDYFSTAIVMSIACNMIYSMAIDYSISENKDPWEFITNYSPNFKSLKFYKMIVMGIWNYIS